MSLIKFYSAQSNKTLNNEALCTGCYKCTPTKFKNISYRTTPLTEFDNISIKQLHQIIEDQQSSVKEMAQLHMKYSYLTPKAYDQTIEQYTQLIFLNNHAYPKDVVIDYVLKQQNEINTFIQQPEEQSPPINLSNTVYVSKEAIRNITGYSYNVLAYHKDPQTNIRSRTKVMGTIEWQKKFIDDMADVIVVDGCRQQGKSMTVAEKAMELSFIPNHDILVCAFSVNATNLIRNYIRKFVKKFPEDAFDENRKEGYITNLKTLTKIHFKTLADEGSNVLGLTIKTAIVDEAHLVDVATFENALEPTLSANDGQLILLGTAAKNKNCYMYQCIMEIKTSKYSQQNSSYYKVSIDENPITSPKLRDKVEANKDRPSYKRQYYNFWGDIGDNLFSIPREVNLPDPNKRNNNEYLVLGIDPARKNDRSGYSLIFVSKGKATIILSGEVPESHKAEWNLQAKFYKELIARFQINLANINQSQNFYIAMDVTGVGDGVSTIFMNEGINLSARIRYTSGNTESNDGFDFNVSKTILINNIVDLSQENVLTVYELTNKLLLEEMEHIEEGADKKGNIKMESDFFDDITNATMVGGYYITHRNFISRSITTEKEKYIPTGNPQIDAIESLEYKGYIPEYKAQSNW